MNNFIFQNSTKVYFGKGCVKEYLTCLTKNAQTILLAYGGGSIKRNGVYDEITDSFPTIYRIDRIKNMSVLDERFHIPYSSRFEEGEFRKRIQFMYGGKIQKVRFRYKGPDIDSILDRLPTAHVLDEENGEYIVAAEVFGTGINMWIRSQGDYIEMIEEV